LCGGLRSIALSSLYISTIYLSSLFLNKLTDEVSITCFHSFVPKINVALTEVLVSNIWSHTGFMQVDSLTLSTVGRLCKLQNVEVQHFSGS